MRARSPRRVIVKEMEIPNDSMIKLHWQAPEALKQLFQSPLGRALQKRDEPEPAKSIETTALPQERPDFSADVRLVSQTVSVLDDEDRPVTGLKPEDFEVYEDGKPVEITFFGAEEIPFNLVLLLDFSGSTEQERSAIVEAPEGFVAIAREHDRVAIYALADTHFQVLAPLTNDRKGLVETVRRIDTLTGGSPLYDIVVLSYAQELARRRGQRNALVLITDGVDNQIQQEKLTGVGVPSKVPFSRLRRASREMDTVIYSIFVDPLSAFRSYPEWKSYVGRWKQVAGQHLEDLASLSGGRVFPANSIRDLGRVYQQVAQELRSVYTIGYHAPNQDFTGAWRSVRVQLSRPDVRVRTRPGYYAR